MRYWKRVNTEGVTTTVEGYSHSLDIEQAIEITKAKYDAFIASLPPPESEPLTPDEARLQQIVATSPDAITMPYIWEAIRILARLRGIE